MKKIISTTNNNSCKILSSITCIFNMTTGNTTKILLLDCFSLCPHLFKLFLNFHENCSHYWNTGIKTHPVFEFLNLTIQSWMHYFIRFKTFWQYLYNGGHVFVWLILSLISRGLVGWPGDCCPALISGGLLSDKLPIVEVAQYI